MSEAVFPSPDQIAQLAEFEALTRHLTFEVLEHNASLRELVMARHEERLLASKLAQTIGTADQPDLDKVTRVMEDAMVPALSRFTENLHRSLLKVWHQQVQAEFAKLHQEIAALRSSVLMTYLNPMGWLKTLVVRQTVEILESQPVPIKPLDEILARLEESGVYVPGANRLDRLLNLIAILKESQAFHVDENFMVELK